MNALKMIIAAAVLVLVSAPGAQAQSTIKDAVFTAVEKRLIRDYYGVSANQQSTDDTAPDWAVKDDDDGDDEDEDRGKKEKGDKGKGKNKDKAKGKSNKGKSKGLPPGLAKREQLPPGLARQLKEKGRLPAGLAKRDLPADLASKLPERPATQDVTVVEGDVVLADKATGIILDVIKDVVKNGANGGATTNPDGTLAAPSSQNQGGEDNLLDAVLKSIFGGGN